MEVHTISLLYFKQADTTKQPTAIQTVTMQPMWCSPNINTYLFSTTGLHEGWKKFMQLEYGNECRCAPSHSFIFKQAVTTKQPASIQVVRNCANTTHVEQPKYQHCLSNTTGLHQGWKKVMQLEYGNWCRFAPSHCHTLSKQLQPNNLQVPVYKVWQCNPCGEPKHQHLLVQYYWFASRLEESHAVRIWELMQVRSISLPYFKQEIATKQPDSIQTETMQPMCPCGATQTSARICSIPLVCTKVGRKTCN